jgi:thiosulfate/3-mercaptopyruvate sulfurtransferase
MGWSNVAVYDGGWFEWSKDPAANPIVAGAVKDAEEVAA